MLGVKQYGDVAAREISQFFAGVASDVDDIRDITPGFRKDGMFVLEKSKGGLWMFELANTATADVPKELLLNPADAPTAGRWKRADKLINLHLPFTFETADAAALLTMPAGFALRPTGHGWWNIAADMTGGASSAIGISTDVTGYDTKGDLLGGATGDVAAGLTAGVKAGTQGGELDDNVGFNAILLTSGDVIRFDRITSAFTAGNGQSVFPVAIDWV